MDVRLGPDDAPNSDEKTIFDSFGSQTRHLIRQAERHGLRVARLDAGGGRVEDDDVSTEPEEFDRVDPDDLVAADAMLRGIYGMLDPAVHRRSAAFASEDAFLDWSRRAIADGHTLYLQAEHPEDGPIAAVGFYRHGHRLTFALVGARPELRRKYPGSVRLLVWRGIQVALDERRSVVDLGGVDTPALRRRPDKGDETYGAYQFRESYGARWVELTGAHRRTMHSLGGSVGRVAAAVRRLGRLAPGR
jgi:lipid II:glycine glycyltransferase (peptidoglycan interpeptide bridge formation enzyme)